MKQNGVSVVYSQLYPFEGLWNYTSGIIHHVKMDEYRLISNMVMMGHDPGSCYLRVAMADNFNGTTWWGRGAND
ncbi:hypothetical protein RND71_025112 [Anisodus tanguticus]|uniref:Uncharacterized protein n=1 Tax=Anisodus tanguticus TaxID=243964 RepID=A0AAE1VA37_9SOLA|nr:hypothetical protein RND71_025112 [Anisodus tanguticus]